MVLSSLHSHCKSSLCLSDFYTIACGVYPHLDGHPQSKHSGCLLLSVYMPHITLYSLENVKIGATTGQILRHKYTKFDFSWGFAQTQLGELTVLPTAGF